MGGEDTPARRLLFTTVRLDITKKDNSCHRGTAFIIGPSRTNDKDDGHADFLVTNKHVVEDAQSCSFSFVIANTDGPILGSRVQINVLRDFDTYCVGHPDKDVDVSVIPIYTVTKELKKRDVNASYTKISLEDIPRKKEAEKFDAIEEVILIGYPIGIMDEKNGLPIVRRGLTATPIYIDYENKPRFLIDAAIFPGSSGSPVFVYTGGQHPGKGLILGGDYKLAGIISHTFAIDSDNAPVIQKIPTEINKKNTSQYINLGVAFNSKAILETIQAWVKEHEQT